VRFKESKIVQHQFN
jgi:hypothetical protein